MNSQLRIFIGLASALILTCAAAGCATYEKCGLDGCPGDANVTANVQARLKQHPDLGEPDSITVQTLDHVVYLNGMVGAGLQSREAESVARGTPGVRRVENSIAVTH
jgi:osmotically-inducible protein OsmY